MLLEKNSKSVHAKNEIDAPNGYRIICRAYMACLYYFLKFGVNGKHVLQVSEKVGVQCVDGQQPAAELP